LENKKLRRENDRLKKQLSHAELIIDVQKKVSQMLEIPPKEDPEEEKG
jgi:regulator of replication initiation timing